PHQKWNIVALPEKEGFLGGAYCKIVIEGTNRALTAAPNCEVIASEYTGADTQLWRIDQLTDGTYRLMPKQAPGVEGQVVLVSTGDSTVGLGKFDMKSDNSKWNLRNH
ncbi:MAG: RICIN domain-containing protein, partial [Salinivirgaceae bacterium]|nr:RICIN domain-containing protein [Salinivirgaceae bacterium]